MTPIYESKREQYQKHGLNDTETPYTQPPPTYPPRTSKLIVVEDGPYSPFHLAWQNRYKTHLRRGPYGVDSKQAREALPSTREFDFLTAGKKKRKREVRFYWDRIPNELYRIYNKKRPPENIKGPLKKHRMKIIKPEQLEEKELSENSPKNENSKSDSENEEEEEAAKDDDENDEEEFDYGNNYFDNGEGFQDEDDNLDDGPLY